jgi:hypothetical protein
VKLAVLSEEECRNRTWGHGQPKFRAMVDRELCAARKNEIEFDTYRKVNNTFLRVESRTEVGLEGLAV